MCGCLTGIVKCFKRELLQALAASGSVSARVMLVRVLRARVY